MIYLVNTASAPAVGKSVERVVRFGDVVAVGVVNGATERTYTGNSGAAESAASRPS